MAKIDWEKIWGSILKNPELFPIKAVDKNKLSISCPTRFSNAGEFAIDITPTFNDASIALQMLLFNENLSLDELSLDGTDDKSSSAAFNKLAKALVDYELSNRVMDRFTIKSDGFSSDEEAENALIDYINNKATESGRMFDDKLDELNDTLANKNESNDNFDKVFKSIRESRKAILKKVESILNTHYNWKSSKNEDYSDSTMQCFDDNNNLMAVVTLADNCILVDLAEGITAKVSMLQSDEEIESEIVDDVDNAQSVMADREIEHLKDVVNNDKEPLVDDEEDYLESLSRRITKLESMLINRKLRRMR